MTLESNAQSTARDKARTRSQTSLNDWLVILRTDWQDDDQPHWYAISKADKRLWTPGETLVDTYRDGEIVEGEPPPAERYRNGELVEAEAEALDPLGPFTLAADYMAAALGHEAGRLALQALRAGWLTPHEAETLEPLAAALARMLGAELPAHRGGNA